MTNRIREIQEKFRKADSLFNEIYCNYSGHWDECEVRKELGNRCDCGYDKISNELFNAMRELGQSTQ